MKRIKEILLIIICLFIYRDGFSQEELFTNYFDVKTNQPEGTKITGKINIKSNKNTHNIPIPKTYNFIFEAGSPDIFEIETLFDNQGRAFGSIKIAPEKNSGVVKDYNLKVILKDGSTIKASEVITIHVVEKTLWKQLKNHYTPITISESRLYGRTKFSESELEHYIKELEDNNGQFLGFRFYNDDVTTFSGTELEDEWQNVSSLIGGLGYSYAKSPIYGTPSENPTNVSRLKRVIYKALLAFMNKVPIYGKDVLIEGNPIGTELGDGFSRLREHGYVDYSFLTHQWRIIDALAAPLLHIWTEVLDDIDNNDSEAQHLFDATIRFHQLFFSVVTNRRVMTDPSAKWGDISDINYSEGAWSDANLGHRIRTLMTMPILWADYNRPITYVPYWYDDYNNGTEIEGTTLGKNWTPNGVLADVNHWSNRMSSLSHTYNQSGFHPDGTVSHHTGHNASDVAMKAYGFEWLTSNIKAIEYFKDSPFEIEDTNFQFVADRLDYTYRRMVYKNSLDFLVTGRSFFSDLSRFGTKDFSTTISSLIENKGTSVQINNEIELLTLESNLKHGTHRHTETTAFWNADYLVHRNEDTNNYFFSVKHKSVRTSGAEDFSKIRKSWHLGSGSFLLRIDGDEYDKKVLENFDWHTVPGVTEEWRTDVMPSGPASASKPGENEFSGISTDGTYGLTGYHHKPIDNYTSAEAKKSYHLIGRYGAALGSKIIRKSNSSGSKEIVTTIDQSEQLGTITYNINGTIKTVLDGVNVDLVEPLTGPTWIHHYNKGYIIFPKTDQNLLIKTGNNINITATDLELSQSINYILALDHGTKPSLTNKDSYEYVMVANATLENMPTILSEYTKNTTHIISEGNYHAIKNTSEDLIQINFFQATNADLGGNDFIEVDKPALIMVKKTPDNIKLTIVDPLHDLNTSEITVKVSEVLKEGTYSYNLLAPLATVGESVFVTSNGTTESTIVISLPDSSDGMLYNYQEQMYAGAPIVLILEKNNSLSIHTHENRINNIRIYPVPLSKNSVIESINGDTILKIETYNSLGQLTQSQCFDKTSSSVKLYNPKTSTNKVLVLRIETNKATYIIKTFN